MKIATSPYEASAGRMRDADEVVTHLKSPKQRRRTRPFATGIPQELDPRPIARVDRIYI